MGWDELRQHSTCASVGRVGLVEDVITAIVEFMTGCAADRNTASTARDNRVTSLSSTLLEVNSTGLVYEIGRAHV